MLKRTSKTKIQKNSKENLAPDTQNKGLNLRTQTKTSFFSIDVSSKSFDHTSKK